MYEAGRRLILTKSIFLVQVDWEPRQNEMFPNWAPAPPKAGPAS